MLTNAWTQTGKKTRPLVRRGVINVMNKILKNILAIIFTLVGTMWIFLAALGRGNNAFGIETFSKKNVLATAVFFAVVMPIIYFIKKRRKNRDSKEFLNDDLHN